MMFHVKEKLNIQHKPWFIVYVYLILTNFQKVVFFFSFGLFVCFLYQLQVSVSINVSLVDIKSKRLLLNYTQSHTCCQPGKVGKSEPRFLSAFWVLLTFLPGSTVSRD